MKKCTKCNQKKELSEYFLVSKKKGTHRSACKVCHRKGNRDSHRKSKDGKYSVYYFPEEHYIGFTQNKQRRFAQHLAKGKIIDGYEIVAEFDNPFDAIILEAEFHRRGYNGFTFKR